MDGSQLLQALPVYLAYVLLVWCVFVLLVQAVGIVQILRHFSSRPRPPVSARLPPDEAPHITIVRPVKGLEHELYSCLASSFLQDYPRDRLSIRLCVAEASDSAHPLLERLIADFPGYDARVLVEAEDPIRHEHPEKFGTFGPNAKVRNISRAYREAKGDIVWMVDCNVWIGRGVAGRMVDKLTGLSPEGPTTPYMFVHQLPLLVDTTDFSSKTRTAWGDGGGRMDEMFMATTHAKFYSAFSTLGFAPCVVGKSNMFRKSHLDAATDPSVNMALKVEDDHPTGIDYFSRYICEDHLIGDILWKWQRPGFAKHALLWGDFAVQPMAGMSVKGYWDRRVRWLRARKWTVLLATLVEPGIESLLWSTYLTFAALVLAPEHGVAIPWSAAPALWLVPLLVWSVADWTFYRKFHSCVSVEVDENTPRYATGEIGANRSKLEWALAWVGRELLALPIWSWAFYGPTTVKWRGKEFRVDWHMGVVEVTRGKIPGMDHEKDA